MKEPYMRTIIGYCGRDCVFIILFQLYVFKAGPFQVNLFWMGKYDLLPLTFILEEALIQHKCNLIQFLNNRSKIIPSQKTAVLILQILKSSFFVASKGIKIQEIDKNS